VTLQDGDVGAFVDCFDFYGNVKVKVKVKVKVLRVFDVAVVALFKLQVVVAQFSLGRARASATEGRSGRPIGFPAPGSVALALSASQGQWLNVY
jgi:hypothetical protein